MSRLDLNPGNASVAGLPRRLRIEHDTADAFPDLYRAWAGDEHWNPGRHEGAALLAQDPEGCFIGYLGDTPVASISVINYDERFAFLGCYRVDPRYRGRGVGLETWKHAVAHAGGRTIGLEGVPAQQVNYRKSGFTLAHRTVRFAGGIPTLRGIRADVVVPAADVGQAAIARFDADSFPANRPRFLASWLTAPDHHGLALVVKGELRGFGVIRPVCDGARVGPLLACTPAEAGTLFDALAAHAADSGSPTIAIDIPETSVAGRALAMTRSLTPVSETARMYTGTIRPVATERIFGVCTLEGG